MFHHRHQTGPKNPRLPAPFTRRARRHGHPGAFNVQAGAVEAEDRLFARLRLTEALQDSEGFLRVLHGDGEMVRWGHRSRGQFIVMQRHHSKSILLCGGNVQWDITGYFRMEWRRYTGARCKLPWAPESQTYRKELICGEWFIMLERGSGHRVNFRLFFPDIYNGLREPQKA